MKTNHETLTDRQQATLIQELTNRVCERHYAANGKDIPSGYAVRRAVNNAKLPDWVNVSCIVRDVRKQVIKLWTLRFEND